MRKLPRHQQSAINFRRNLASALVGSRYPGAIAAGVLLALSYPKAGIAGFAWIAPGAMIAAALGKRGAETFRIGYVAGLAYYLVSLYWLLLIPVTGFPILGWTALCAYLALYPATWVWLCVRFCRTPAAGTAESNWLESLRGLAASGWSWRIAWTMFCAAAWVALEAIVSRFLGGLPWNLLAVSQHRILPLIQIAGVTGTAGISFVVAWTSVSLLCAAAVIVSRPETRSPWIGEILLPFLAVIGLFGYGFHQLRQPVPTGGELRVTLVQPSIPQSLIWNPTNDLQRFHDLLQLSEAALTNRTDLLIWPESAIPKQLRYDREIYDGVTGLASRHRVWMIVGSDDAEPARTSSTPNETLYYNSSFLVDPQGRLVTRYIKRNLVMFGEYIPLEHTLPFVKWFTPVQGSFTPGTSAVSFEFPAAATGAARTREIKTSVLICFEDTFASLARRSAGPDTDFLVNITNDGWFGEGAAQWQHAAAALFRAIENGVSLIRCANNGLTCWYDANGRLQDRFLDAKGTIYGPGFLTIAVPLIAPGEQHVETYYHRHGAWFELLCVVIAAFGVLRALSNRRSGSSGN